MTCKDCLHHDVCVIVEHSTCKDEDYLTEFGCEDFKDRDHDKWIPVAERLPAENGSYLVATERGGVFITHYWADGQRFSSRGGRTVITHWKERPLPPKKEE